MTDRTSPPAANELDAVTARRLIGEGSLSPVELLDACLAQVDRVDGAVNAMVIRADERARAEAEAAEAAVQRGEPLGALHGLPVAIKDLQPTEGITTTFGSADLADNVPTVDAPIVAKIRQAGGIVVGKTNIPEFSIGANTLNRLFGATGNPFDTERSCGGSSGGSAVVLAAEMVPLATGSDHGGSLRIPACYCGVVGFRATPGVVPHEARTTTQTFYSVQGPMARTVDDTALLLSVIAERVSRDDPMAFPLDASQFAPLDPVDIADLRIGYSTDLGGVMVSEPIRAEFVRRLELLEGVAGSVTPVDIDLTGAADIDWKLRSDVFVSQYYQDAAGWDEGFNPNIRASYDGARAMPMEDIAQARRRQVDLYRSTARVFDDVDVLLCPGVSVSPFPWRDLFPREVDGKPVENYMAWLTLTAAFTVVGFPVCALPAGLDTFGLPFGIQVVGAPFEDRSLLGAARAIEQAFATDDLTRRPRPDFAQLADARTDCRSAGIQAATAAAAR